MPLASLQVVPFTAPHAEGSSVGQGGAGEPDVVPKPVALEDVEVDNVVVGAVVLGAEDCMLELDVPEDVEDAMLLVDAAAGELEEPLLEADGLV